MTVGCIEPSPTARAKCRACREVIAKGEYRFGDKVDNPYGEGEANFWYHLRCAALRIPERFAPVLQGFEAKAELDPELEGIVQNAEGQPRLPNVVRADHAPTNRARCQNCRRAIDKGSWRIVLERMDSGISAAAGFLHVPCAALEVGAAPLGARLHYCEPTRNESDTRELLHLAEQQVPGDASPSGELGAR